MADILYTYNGHVYANITNQCNCRCTFCIRFLHDCIGSADTLWHKENPSKEAVLEAIRNYDFTGQSELVFCGYGEPTCALDILLEAARIAKEEKHLNVRLNTNGLGALQNGKDIAPELAKVVDTVSISLNAPDEAAYNAVTRPQLDGAYRAMLSFAKACKENGINVKLTVVDVLPDEQIEASRKLAEDIGIALRVREFS